jgi:Cu-Zn family superoxide dismutase
VGVLTSAGALAQVPSVGATAQLLDTTNRVVATAEFREGRGEVLITINFPNPPVLSGTHAVHINETARCDPPDYSTSGNIFNPLGKKHGRQNPEGAEVGDLPNINFSNGLTSYNTTAPGGTLSAGAASLLSPNRSIVILSGEDDQLTDPDGKSGTRVACGVITAGAAAPAAQAAPGAPVVGLAPTPTPAVAPAVPKIASPVPVQAAQPPAQPVAAQPAGQPAVKPASSPVVVAKPVVVNPNAGTSPVVAAPAAAIPTPIVVPTAAPLVAAAAAQPQQSSSGLGSLTALIVAVLGVGLVGVGYLLRRRSQLQR